MTSDEEKMVRQLAKQCDGYYPDFETFLVVKARKYGIASQIESYISSDRATTTDSVIEHVMRLTKGVS